MSQNNGEESVFVNCDAVDGYNEVMMVMMITISMNRGMQASRVTIK